MEKKTVQRMGVYTILRQYFPLDECIRNIIHIEISNNVCEVLSDPGHSSLDVFFLKATGLLILS